MAHLATAAAPSRAARRIETHPPALAPDAPVPVACARRPPRPATQQTLKMADGEVTPFVVPLPLADAAGGGGASAGSVPQISAYRLGGALAMQHGAVVFRESTLGPLIGSRSLKAKKLEELLGDGKTDLENFRRWNGVVLNRTRPSRRSSPRTKCASSSRRTAPRPR